MVFVHQTSFHAMISDPAIQFARRDKQDLKFISAIAMATVFMHFEVHNGYSL
jgi:hypothetical protein